MTRIARTSAVLFATLSTILCCFLFTGQAIAAQNLSASAPGATSGSLSTQATSYDIWVAGKQVTSANANDVLGDGGSVKYAAKTQTLTLKNAKIKKGRMSGDSVLESISYKLTGTFTIKLVGKNTISAPKTSSTPNYAYGIADWNSNKAKLKFTGSGSLTVHAADASYISQAIAVWKGMVVQGSATLKCYGGKSTQKSTGIEVMGGLTVKGKAQIVASGETGAFTKAPKFSSYTPKVKAGYSSSSIKVNKKKPAKKVYTKYPYVKITKASSSKSTKSTTTKKKTSSPKAPSKVKLVKLTPDSNKIWVYWNSVSGATAYQMQVCSSKKFPKASTYFYKKIGNSSTSSKPYYTYAFDLKNGTKYYVRMRAFKTSGGKTSYGAWSNVLSCTPRASSGSGLARA